MFRTIVTIKTQSKVPLWVINTRILHRVGLGRNSVTPLIVEWLRDPVELYPY